MPNNVQQKYVCPRCGSPVIRTSRRMVDRFMSLFKLVYRYRCSSLGCGWEGNFSPPPGVEAGKWDRTR